MQTVVQMIETRWTGASRGAPGATARNAVPERVAIPDTELADPVLLHRVSFAERCNFAVEHSSTVARFTDNDRHLFHLAVDPGEQSAHVTFYDASFGTKFKNTVVADVLLKENCWCQYIVNYRIAEDDGWAYRKRVFNIFHGLRYRASELMASKPPMQRIDHQKHLW